MVRASSHIERAGGCPSVGLFYQTRYQTSDGKALKVRTSARAWSRGAVTSGSLSAV